jgi:hypothetical protein
MTSKTKEVLAATWVEQWRDAVADLDDGVWLLWTR